MQRLHQEPMQSGKREMASKRSLGTMTQISSRSFDDLEALIKRHREVLEETLKKTSKRV